MTPTFAALAILHADWREGRPAAEIAERINRTLGLSLTAADVSTLARVQDLPVPLTTATQETR